MQKFARSSWQLAAHARTNYRAVRCSLIHTSCCIKPMLILYEVLALRCRLSGAAPSKPKD